LEYGNDLISSQRAPQYLRELAHSLDAIIGCRRTVAVPYAASRLDSTLVRMKALRAQRARFGLTMRKFGYVIPRPSAKAGTNDNGEVANIKTLLQNAASRHDQWVLKNVPKKDVEEGNVHEAIVNLMKKKGTMAAYVASMVEEELDDMHHTLTEVTPLDDARRAILAATYGNNTEIILNVVRKDERGKVLSVEP
jgi:hypothetical protein